MAAPSPTLLGVNDQSRRAVPVEPTRVSQHTPLLLLNCQMGSLDYQLINTADFELFYGSETLNVGSNYNTHQTELMRVALAAGNGTVIIKRVTDSDSRSATLNIVYDPVPDALVGLTQEDYLNADLSAEFAIKPLFAIEAANPGAWGNNLGVKVYAAEDRLQRTLGAATGCFVYMFVLTIQNTITGNVQPIRNLNGDDATAFVLKPDSLYRGTNYFFDDIIKESYIQNPKAQTRTPYLKSVSVNTQSIADLVQDEDEQYAADVLTTLSNSGTAAFGKTRVNYLRGGSDGFLSNARSSIDQHYERNRKYEMACIDWLSSLDDTDALTDMAQYPFSCIVDTGFTELFKESLYKLIRLRSDIYPILSVYSLYQNVSDDEGDDYFIEAPALTAAERISLAANYRTMLQAVPESTDYGTSTCRGFLMLQDGVNRNSIYRKRQSLAVDLFEKLCLYYGRADGIPVSTAAFDEENNRTINNWTGISNDYMSPVVKDLAWVNGVIYVENLTAKTMYYPAYQSVYPDDTSVLNNLFTVHATCVIKKQQRQAWAQCSGNGRLTDAEFIEQHDLILTNLLKDKFDDRFVVTVNTYYTGADVARGNSYTTEVNMYCNTTKHDGIFTIITHRMSDYIQQ